MPHVAADDLARAGNDLAGLHHLIVFGIDRCQRPIDADRLHGLRINVVAKRGWAGGLELDGRCRLHIRERKRDDMSSLIAGKALGGWHLLVTVHPGDQHHVLRTFETADRSDSGASIGVEYGDAIAAGDKEPPPVAVDRDALRRSSNQLILSDGLVGLRG
jgi:hypothetical protein